AGLARRPGRDPRMRLPVLEPAGEDAGLLRRLERLRPRLLLRLARRPQPPGARRGVVTPARRFAYSSRVLKTFANACCSCVAVSPSATSSSCSNRLASWLGSSAAERSQLDHP